MLRALLLCGSFFLLNACSQDETDSPAVSFRIVSAERHIRSREDPQSEKAHWATSATLVLLEKTLSGPRICRTRHGLDGNGYFGAIGGRPLQWISCSLEDGEIIKVFVFGKETIWLVEGEGPYELDMAAEDARAVLQWAGWKGLREQKLLPGPGVVKWSLLDLQDTRSRLQSELMLRMGQDQPNLVSAERFLFGSSTLDESGNFVPRMPISLGHATPETLEQLGASLFAHRVSTLLFMPGGGVYEGVPDANPEGWMDCLLDDGLEVRVFYFADGGPWIEHSDWDFRIDIGSFQMQRILDPRGWE